MFTVRRRFVTVFFAIAAAPALVLSAAAEPLSPPVAHAHPVPAIYNQECAGESPSHVIRGYRVSPRHGDFALLRCGTDSYGYYHIKKRRGFFGESTNAAIQKTLDMRNRAERSGSSVTYVWDHSGFLQNRLVIENMLYSDGGHKGVITFYTATR